MTTVALDATVLCSGIQSEFSIDARILEVGSTGLPFDAFTTEVVGYEFLRNATTGLQTPSGLRTFTMEQVEDFLDTYAPIFDPDNIRTSPIGRALTSNHALHDRPLGEVVYAMTGCDTDGMLDDLENQPTLRTGPSVRHFDPFDLHLALAAINHGADVICTSNTTDYSMANIGPVRILTPKALAAEYSI